MTKAELIENLYSKFEGDITKRTVGELVDGVFDNMSVALKKEHRFSYPGFGTWEVRRREARKGRNPQTGEIINIKASNNVGFKAAKALKDEMAKVKGLKKKK